MRKTILFLLFPAFLGAQSWIDKMQDPTHNFYDTQNDFEEFWENKTIEKGKGWKQFKRWENFIKPRVYPDGIQHPELLMQEYNNLLEFNTSLFINPPNVWTQVGPDDVPLQSSGTKRGIGRVNTIAFHPTDPNILYVGAPAGGFWKSLNGGQTWNTTTDFLTNLGVSDIAINPNNPDEIYIITGDRDGGDTYSYGLMKSLDGGLTFNVTGLSFNVISYYKGNRILIDPTNTSTIIVATSNGIYRSIDAAGSFAHTYAGINMTDIEFHTTNSNIIYGASKGSTSIYKSTDNGINWSQSGSGLPATNNVVRACVAVTPANPQLVYALFGNNNNGFYGVYKSINEGATWTQQSNSPNLLGWSSTGSDSGGQAWYDLAFAVSPINENTLFVGGVNTWKSINGGQSWNINTHWTGSGGADYMHADEHMIKYNTLNGNIYSGNDGGLYYSTDEVNWTDISDGLHITQFYSLGVSQSVQDKVITGSQDNGTFLKTNFNWDAVIGGDGMECIIDYNNSNIMYGEVYYGGIRKSTNGGNSFSSIAPSNNGAWETPYDLDKNNPNIIYAGYDELYKTIDAGNNWNIITNGETNGGKINEIGISKSNADVIYFTDDANIFKTTDGGLTWNQINNNLPYKYISYVIVHPTDPDRVWVTFSGYTAGEKVYKSIDGGNNWVNISGTLPNIPVNCIELDKNNLLETVYIGSDLGVFTIDSTLTDWNLFNNNSLPNVIVNELEIQYQSNTLFAATYGRGLWSIDLQITSPPIADFSYSDSIFCNVPADVTFLNNSYYSSSYYWDFGDGSTSTATNPTYSYTTFGTFTVQLVVTGPLGTDSIIKQQIISVDQANNCPTILPVSGAGNIQTLCNGTLYDVGGPNGNYYDANDSWITIAPPGSNQITLTFNSFDIEAPSNGFSYCNWDYLEIFDGLDTTAASLGQYCNTLTGSPGTIISSTGAITVLLHSDQAVNGTGFEADWTCTFPTAPPISTFYISDTISCNTSISFTDMSLNGPSSWFWDFGDGSTSNIQHPVHTYLSSGIFNVKLVTTNPYGIDSVIVNNAVTIIDVNLQTTDAASCGNSSLVLAASSSAGIINWYSDNSLQNFLGSGSTYITPLLSNTTSYFAQSVYEFNNLFGGPSDNSIGPGSYYQGSKYLIFDNYNPATLVSVLVYANSDAFRTIELRNSSNMVLLDTTVFIPTSPNGIRIYLNFDLPIQNNMQLGMSGSNNDMFRTSSGAIFPYNISDIVSITGTNAPAGYYYFFYDWELQKESCNSNISEVIATINNSVSSLTSITTCDSYLWNNNLYTQTGLYLDTSINTTGCLQIDSLDLIITTTVGTSSYLVCDSYNWNGQLLTQSGSYSQTFTSINGCDSIHNLILSVLNSTIGTSSVNSCNSYNWNNQIITSSGLYTQTFLNSSGCDSTHTLNATINQEFNIIDQVNFCGSYTWIDGVTYSASNNIAMYNLLSVSGCDSTIYLDLIINNNTSSTSSQISCDEFIWPINGYVYDTSGLYIDSTLINFCWQIDTLLLTINNSTYSTINDTSCDSYIWNNNVYTASGIYTENSYNTTGCVHVDSLFLSINTSVGAIHSFTEYSCDSFYWNENVYHQSGTYYDTIMSNNNCDSIQKLNLTITNSPVVLIIQNIDSLKTDIQASQYLWNTGDSTQFIIPLSSGTYWCIAYNSYGCPSDTAFFNYTVTAIDNKVERSFRIYPNPTNGILNISFNNKGNTLLKLTNVLGEHVAELRINKTGYISTFLDISDYSSGVYFIEVKSKEEKLNYKVILQ